MAKIRTFICFELPDSVQDVLAELQATLKNFGRGVSWVRPEGIHLTLKFLGDVDESKIDDVVSAVTSAAKDFSTFQIEISETGAFPNLNRPRVYWVGVKEPTGVLFSLQQKIDDELELLGLSKESRKFSPHLTVGRVKFAHGLNNINRALEEVNLPSMDFLADDIIVMHSELQPKGARYTPLAIIPLKS